MKRVHEETVADGEPPVKRSKKDDILEQEQTTCPYLDTINRKILDFDFEKACSLTPAKTNVYGCLVCGKYFQGRGMNTPAYIHSLDHGHHVFIHLHNGRVWCIPDNYEVIDASLEDIKFNLNPQYTDEQIEQIDNNTKYPISPIYINIARLRVGLNGATFYPGFVGLNNIKETDGFNVVIQSLAQVKPIRNFFLKPNNLTTVRI
jgi:U4/U6.U5 tri-snRNP-associated protein 2